MNRMGSISPSSMSLLERAREIESDLKRALYGAVERVQATKAALYLATQHAAETPYELVTSYAYNPAGRVRIDHKDVIVARLYATSQPFIVNGMTVDAEAAEILFRQHNERLLAMPVFGRGRRMIGILDLRDKAGRRPFDQNDITAAETICSDICSVLAARDLYGVGSVALVDVPPASVRVAEPMIPLRREAPGPVAVPPGAATLSAEALEVIRLARERMQKRAVTSESRRRFVTTDEAARMAVLLPAALSIPGAVAVSLTVPNGQWISATGPVPPESAAALRPKNHAAGASFSPSVVVSGDGVPVMPERVRTVASVAVASHLVDQATLCVAFEQQPSEDAKRQFGAFGQLFGQTLAAAIGHSAWSAQREAVAERLIEPDLQRFPALSDHSHLVSGIAERFARGLGLPPEAVEDIRLAALVHDVGLRLLDYDRLVGRVELTPEHQKALHEHPLVGATIVAPVLGTDIAEAVLHHHERWDGQGYPGRLAGNRIPIAARVIAIADAWAAIRSPWAHPPRKKAGDPVSCLRADAGTQFDPSLVGAFLANLHEIDP